MRLSLGDLNFTVAEATLTGSLPDPYWRRKYSPAGSEDLFWSLDCQAHPMEVEGETWQPRLYHESFYLAVSSWTQLAGQTLQWDSPYDEATDEPNGGLYVFKHGEIGDSVLNIGPRSGRTFEIEWSGHADVGWNARYGNRVPFSLQATGTFGGILASGSIHDTPEAVRTRLARYLALADLEEGPFSILPGTYEDGVTMAQLRFTPRPQGAD